MVYNKEYYKLSTEFIIAPFCEEDYVFYPNLLKEWGDSENIEIWAYCLMTNQVHLILKLLKTQICQKPLVKHTEDIREKLL